MSSRPTEVSGEFTKHFVGNGIKISAELSRALLLLLSFLETNVG